MWVSQACRERCVRFIQRRGGGKKKEKEGEVDGKRKGERKKGYGRGREEIGEIEGNWKRREGEGRRRGKRRKGERGRKRELTRFLGICIEEMGRPILRSHRQMELSRDPEQRTSG